MSHILCCKGGDGPVADLGAFLALDGCHGAPVALDLDRPHVGLVTGKRGSGKSYTMGVLAEGLATAEGVTGIVIDPMGVLTGLAARPSTGIRAWIIEHPRSEPMRLSCVRGAISSVSARRMRPERSSGVPPRVAPPSRR